MYKRLWMYNSKQTLVNDKWKWNLAASITFNLEVSLVPLFLHIFFLQYPIDFPGPTLAKGFKYTFVVHTMKH